MSDPYHALGLRGNPFIAEPAPGVAPHLWIERGAVPPTPAECCLVQLLGEKGAGKTSLLLHWREWLPGPYHYVPPDRSRWQLPPLGPIAYWDELDRLPWPLLVLALLRARYRRATVIAGTHRNLTATAHAVGLTVRTVDFAPISATMLQQWAAQRITAAQLPATIATLALDRTTAEQIAHSAATSWREAADLLHIWAAEQARTSAN